MITFGRDVWGRSDAMLVEVRAEPCNAKSHEDMQSGTGIKKPHIRKSEIRVQINGA